jgi:hydroxymethylpyrimidine/phosphomethylpyrimidine kinase
VSEEEREAVMARIRSSAAGIAAKIDPRLIPDQGLLFGFAVRGARDSSGIGAVRGGIRPGPADENQDRMYGFSSDPVIARIILTAMKFDPLIRSAAVARCTPGILVQVENLFFDLCIFDAAQEPPGISTMDWGVASCCRDGVPDVIANRPSAGKPAYLRFFGETPEEVATNIIMVSNRVINIKIQGRSEWESSHPT